MENSSSNTQRHEMASMKYSKFSYMIMVGTFIMIGLMYFNTFSLDHLFFSETRFYMAIMMGAVMAMVMLIFMWKMYPNKKLNAGILAVSSIVFFVSLWLVRSQATVEDVAYMRAMIPHHSVAILTSERANIKDPRVRKLADGIIAVQKKEIDEMKDLIQDLETE